MINIEALVEDLRPIKPVQSRTAFAIAIAATAALGVTVSLVFGLRADIAAMNPAPIVLLRGITLLFLGFATLQAMALSARPGVGLLNNGWKWLLGVAVFFPIFTALSWIQGNPTFYGAAGAPSGFWCLGVSIGAAVMIGTALTIWLRRGAPVNAHRSSWLVGLASGALGTFCYNLYCPSQSIEYAGIWYSLAIGISACLARLTASKYIRW